MKKNKNNTIVLLIFFALFIKNTIISSEKNYKQKIIFFLQNNKKELIIGSLLSGAAIYYYFKNQKEIIPNNTMLKDFTDILKQYYEGYTINELKKNMTFDKIVEEGKKYLDFKTLQTQCSELSINYIDFNTFEFNKKKFLNEHSEYNNYFELEDQYYKQEFLKLIKDLINAGY